MNLAVMLGGRILAACAQPSFTRTISSPGTRGKRALDANRWNGPGDFAHLAWATEEVGRGERHACESLLEQIIIHLFKLRCATAEAPRAHWANEFDRCHNEFRHCLPPGLSRASLGSDAPLRS